MKWLVVFLLVRVVFSSDVNPDGKRINLFWFCFLVWYITVAG